MVKTENLHALAQDNPAMNPTQIAAEARMEITKIVAVRGVLDSQDRIDTIIQAAIEKATEDLRNANVNLLRSLNAAQGEIIELKAARQLASRAAHTSEVRFAKATTEGEEHSLR